MGFKVKVAVFAVIIGYLSPHLWNFWLALGFHHNIYPHSPGKCHLREEIANGAEDMQVTSNGLAFVTSGLRILEVLHNPKFKDVTGNIFLFDFNHPENDATALSIIGDFDWNDFNPHGISVLETDGRVILYVVNHHMNLTTSIMKFNFNHKSKDLTYLKSIFDENIKYANDVVAVEEDVFYYTNYLYWPNVAEIYLGVKWHSIGFYDNGITKLVVTGLAVPNGINMSPNKKYLYTPTPIGRTIDVYSRKEDNSLELVQKYPVYTLCDNIDVHAETGDLWTGCFPLGHRIMKYLSDPDEISPVKILKLTTEEGLISGMSEVYAGDGTGLRGCTIGVRYKDQMLAGSIFTSPMYCELNYLTP